MIWVFVSLISVWVLIGISTIGEKPLYQKPSIPREILLWLHNNMECETCGLKIDVPKANIVSSKPTGGIAPPGTPEYPKEWIVIEWLREKNSEIETANEIRTRRVYR